MRIIALRSFKNFASHVVKRNDDGIAKYATYFL